MWNIFAEKTKKSKRPIIGVTRPLAGGWSQNIAIRFALFLSGAKSVNISVKNPMFDTDFDGLVISGGTDLSPELYGSSDIKKGYRYDRKRDRMELAWIKEAEKKGIPLFCICRGAQLLNVSRGGDLHLDISKAYKNADYPNSLWAKIFFRKETLINKASLFFRLIGKGHLCVNSMHTQAVDSLGEGLCVSSQEENGVIQSFEDDAHPFLMAFQFHPEFLVYKKEIRGLFKALVTAARRRCQRLS